MTTEGNEMNMDEAFSSRKRFANVFYTAVLSLTLPLFLAACGGGGDASGSASPAVAVSPSSPTTVSNAATLAWDPPATATNLSGYRLYYGTAPGTYLQPYGQGYSVGNVTTYSLMGLSSGTRYYFAVTAVDILGNESAYSNETYKDIP
jgi:hypothetical protein